MRAWLDTEFIEDGRTIDLMSVGMVREDGLQFYRENAGCDLSRASSWVRENVIPHLRGGVDREPRSAIARDIVAFAGEAPEFWAYYAAYDWVALCQLFGTMMDLPKGWPMFCLDVQQEAHVRGIRDLDKVIVRIGPEHNALADAQWTQRAWEFLRSVPPRPGAAMPVGSEEAA